MVARDQTVKTRLTADVSNFVAGMAKAKAAAKSFGDEINTSSDRTAWLAQSALALGPALVPIGAAAVPAMTALATGMGAAAGAAVTAGIAFNGVGDALKNLNDYQLDPSAANLKKMHEAMKAIGPDGEQFVKFLDEIGPAFATIQDEARGGLFPGVEEGIRNLLPLLPRLQTIVGELARGMGELAADGGDTLAGPRFTAFFEYLETDARQILTEMGRALGLFFEGFAGMLVGFRGVSAQFSGGLEDMARSFATWSRGLDQNDSFQAFVAYIQQSGPKVLDLFGSIIDAFVELAESAAPIGDVMLPVLEHLFDLIGMIADTPLGPVFLTIAAATSAYGRAVAVADATMGGFIGKLAKTEKGLIAQSKAAKTALPSMRDFGTTMYRAGQSAKHASEETKKARASVGAFGRAAAPAGAAAGILALQMTGVSDSIGLSNTGMGAMIGLMAGPWGAAIGAGVGFASDFANANDDIEASLRNASKAIDGFSVEAIQSELDNLRRTAAELADVGLFPNMRQMAALFAGDAAKMSREAAALEERLRDLNNVDANKVGGIGDLLANGLGKGLDQVAQDADGAEYALAQFLDQVDEMDARLEQERGLLQFRDSLRRLVETVEDNPLGVKLKEGLDPLSDVGEQTDEVRDGFLDIIKATNDYRAGLTGLEHVEFTRNAIQQIRDLGEKLDIPREQVDALLREFGIIDRTVVKPKAELDTKPATDEADRLLDFLDGMEPDEVPVDADTKPGRSAVGDYLGWINDQSASIDVYADLVESSVAGVLAGLPKRSADGSTVPKDGGAYADRFPYLLAPGEEVISNRDGQADRNRDLLKAINAGRLADGGTVRATRSSGSLMVGIDYERLARAVMSSAPQSAIAGGPSSLTLRIGEREFNAVVDERVGAGASLAAQPARGGKF